MKVYGYADFNYTSNKGVLYRLLGHYLDLVATENADVRSKRAKVAPRPLEFGGAPEPLFEQLRVALEKQRKETEQRISELQDTVTHLMSTASADMLEAQVDRLADRMAHQILDFLRTTPPPATLPDAVRMHQASRYSSHAFLEGLCGGSLDGVFPEATPTLATETARHEPYDLYLVAHFLCRFLGELDSVQHRHSRQDLEVVVSQMISMLMHYADVNFEWDLAFLAQFVMKIITGSKLAVDITSFFTGGSNYGRLWRSMKAFVKDAKKVKFTLPRTLALLYYDNHQKTKLRRSRSSTDKPYVISVVTITEAMLFFSFGNVNGSDSMLDVQLSNMEYDLSRACFRCLWLASAPGATPAVFPRCSRCRSRCRPPAAPAAGPTAAPAAGPTAAPAAPVVAP